MEIIGNACFMTTCVLVLFGLQFFINSGYAVRVVCKTSIRQFTKACSVGIIASNSHVTLVKQDPGSQCILRTNYMLLTQGDKSFIWVGYGCSGTFDVITPSYWYAWSSWGPCSVSCGSGQRFRTRRCSSGRDEDCAKEGIRQITSKMTRPCNSGTCVITKPPACGFSPKGYRILGGQEAKQCQFPWMAMIITVGTKQKCGGTIIDKNHILTAAHCMFRSDSSTGQSIEAGSNDLLVYTGTSTMPIGQSDDFSPGLIKRTVSKVTIHEQYQYSSSTYANDIAVLTLKRPIVFDACHVPVCLVTEQMSVYNATGCGTMGWGVTQNTEGAKASSKLQWTNFKIVAKDKCKRMYGVYYQPKGFCAGGDGHDSCGGDSGGPAICKGDYDRSYQYGIVSNGFDGLCGKIAGQYTHVPQFVTWIHKQLV